MTAIVKKGSYFKVLLTLFLPLLFLVLKPINLTSEQGIVLGALFTTIIWWGTGWVYKDAASIFLLTTFIIFGNTPIKDVFYFPLSDNFILVITSFLLSQGIVNSKLADKIASYILSRYCNNAKRLVIISFILGVLLLFAIPQPFARVILLSTIYIAFLDKAGVDADSKKVLIFSIFVASTITSLMFLNGDIIINYSAMEFGGVHLSYFQWAKYMAVPTLVTAMVILIGFLVVFRRNLTQKIELAETEKQKLTIDSKKALFITGLIVLLWLTETIHGFSAAKVAIFGTALMYVVRIIKLRDLRVINISLLIFLTAEFAVGRVLTGSGTAIQISNFLMQFFPSPDSIMYLPFIILLIIIMHMIMGSLVTAISVLIPTLITITAGNLSPELIVLLVCTSVCFHFILPFHHVSILIGYGNGYYDNKHTIKMGLALSIITVVAVMFIYLPWWKLLNLLQ